MLSAVSLLRRSTLPRLLLPAILIITAFAGPSPRMGSVPVAAASHTLVVWGGSTAHEAASAAQSVTSTAVHRTDALVAFVASWGSSLSAHLPGAARAAGALVSDGAKFAVSAIRTGVGIVVQQARRLLSVLAPVYTLWSLLTGSSAHAASGPIGPGAVSTVASGVAGVPGGLAIVGPTAYVASSTSSIAQVALPGGTSSLYIGSSTVGCSNNGSASTFSGIAGLASDGTSLYVLESGGSCLSGHSDIRVVTPISGTPTVTTLTTALGGSYQVSMAYAGGTLYVFTATTIYAVAVATGATSTFALASSVASGDSFYGGTVDPASGELFASAGSSSSTAQMYVYQLSGGTPVPLANTTGSRGYFTALGGYLYATAPYGWPTNIVRIDEVAGGIVPVTGAGSTTSGPIDGTGTDAWFTNVTALATDGMALYAVDGTALREIAAGAALPSAEPAAPLITLNPAKVTTVTPGSFTGQPVVTGGFAYVANATDSEITQVNLSTGAQSILAGTGTPAACGSPSSSLPRQSAFIGLTGYAATDGYYLYATESCTTAYNRTYVAITRTNLTGPHAGDTSVLWEYDTSSFTPTLTGLTLGSDGNLYSQVYGPVSGVAQISTTTGAVVADASPLSGLKSIQAVGPTLYMLTTTGTATSLYTMPVGGSTATLLATPAAIADGVAFVVAGSYSYVFNAADSQLFRVDLANGFTTLSIAGAGQGLSDGTGTDAWFSYVRGLASDGTNLWVVDSSGLRELSPGTPLSQAQQPSPTVNIGTGRVSTLLAGSFIGVPVVVGGYAYAVPSGGTSIDRIDLSSGTVTALAGTSSGSCTSPTASAGQPAFAGLNGALATDGYYLYSEEGCQAGGTGYLNILRTTLLGPDTGDTSILQSTVAYGATLRFLAYGSDGELYTVSSNMLEKVNPLSGASTGVASVPANTTGVAALGSTIYALSQGPNPPAPTPPNYVWPTVISTMPVGGSTWTQQVSSSSAPAPQAFVVTDSTIYVASYGEVYQIPIGTWSVSPVAGSGNSASGAVDGTGTDAWFNQLTGIASDGTNLWVLDGTVGLREIMPGLPLPAVEPNPPSTNIAPAYVQADGYAGLGGVVVGATDYTVSGNEILATSLATGATSVFAGATGASCTGALTQGLPALYAPLSQLTTNGHYLYVVEQLPSYTSCNYGPGFWQVMRISLSPATPGAASIVGVLSVPPNNSLDGLSFGSDGNLYAPVSAYSCYGTSNTVYVLNPITGVSWTYQPNFAVGAYASDTAPLIVSSTVYGSTIYYSAWVSPYIQISPCGATSPISNVVFSAPLGSPATSVVAGSASAALLSDIATDGTWMYGVANGTTVVQENLATGAQSVIAGNTSVTPNSVFTGLGNESAFPSISGLAIDPSGSAIWVSAGGQLAALTQAPSPALNPGAILGDEVLGRGNVSEQPTHLNGGGSVDTATGNFTTSATDATTAGRGIPLTFTRTYNSLNFATPGTMGLGLGWTSTWSDVLAYDPNYGPSVMDVAQSNGSVTRFVSDGQGNWSAPGRVLASLVYNSSTATYTYTVRHRTIYTFASPTLSTPGHLLTVADLNGYTDTLVYRGLYLRRITDPWGRALSFSYNGYGQLASITDPAGNLTTYTYSSTTTTAHLASVTDPQGNMTKYGYNSTGQMTTVTFPSGVVLTTGYTGNLATSQTSPTGGITLYAYHLDGTQTGTTQVDAQSGATTTITYSDGQALSSVLSASGLPTESTSYAYDALTKGVLSVTTPTGSTTSYTYDTSGDVMSVTLPNGHVESFTYDALGDQLTSTDAMGVTTSRTYDTHGNILTSSVTMSGDAGSTGTATTTYTYAMPPLTGDVLTTTNALGYTTGYAYDSYGDVKTVLDPDGNVTTFTYNVLGQRTSRVAPDGNVSGATPSTFTTTYTYYADGRLATVTTPGNSITTRTYTADGQLYSLTDPNGHATTYTYDGDGNLTAVHYADGSTSSATYDLSDNKLTSTDASNNVTTYTYDAYGRRTSMVGPAPSNPTTTYTYDLANRLSTITTAVGTTTYTYDPSGNVATIAYSDGSPGVAYTYDPANRVTSVVDGAGTTTYTYNSLGQQTSQTRSGPLGTLSVSYAHDLGGQTTQITYPHAVGSGVVAYGYDPAGRMTSLTDFFNQATTFGYDASGNLTSQVDPNGLAMTSTYYPSGTLDTRSYVGPTGTLVQLGYGYDPANQVTAATTGGSALAATSTTYGYDVRERLATVNATALAYTNAGSVTASEAAPSQSYNALSELTASGATTYGYNAVGERTSATTGSSSTAYAWSLAGTLSSVTGPTGSVSYTYDASGLLAARTSGASTAPFTWDNAGSLALLLDDGTTAYLYGPSSTPVEQVDLANASANGAGADTFLLVDVRGSVVATTDDAGSVTSTRLYDSAGNVTSASGAVSNLGYAGQWSDPVTGLLYLRARWYDPATSQLLGVDPALATTGQPYAYANDNPVNFVDLSGLCVKGFSWACSTPHEMGAAFDGARHWVWSNRVALATIAIGAAGLAAAVTVVALTAVGAAPEAIAAAEIANEVLGEVGAGVDLLACATKIPRGSAAAVAPCAAFMLDIASVAVGAGLIGEVIGKAGAAAIGATLGVGSTVMSNVPSARTPGYPSVSN